MSDNIQLVDKNQDICNEWEKRFSDCDDVTVYCGGFFDLEADCVVSPANSFGFMDGGLDALITKRFGRFVQNEVQKILKRLPIQELLVGQALLVHTNDEDIPYCMSAPTMRVPMKIDETVNVYLAAKAIFDLFKQTHYIHTITISGLGTGVGGVPPEVCAKQMRQAYDEVWLGKGGFPNSWSEAQDKHQLLYNGDPSKDLQH